MPRIYRSFQIALISCLVVAAPALQAKTIYRWVDDQGVVHFGHRLPDGVSASQELNIAPQPAPEASTEPVSPEAAVAPTVPATSDIASAENTFVQGQMKKKEKPLTYAQQRRADRAERREKYTEEARKMRANCEIVERQVAYLEPSPRVLVQDGDGTTRRLDDDERERLLDEAKSFAAKNCQD